MEKESNIPEQSTDAALELFRCVRHLVDTSVKNCLQSMPQQVMQMTGQLDKIQTAQQQSLFDLGSVKQQLETMTSMSLLLENAGKANHLLGTQHYDEHIIQPIIRSLFPVLDLIEDSYRYWTRSEQETNLLKSIWRQMQQFLAVYDVFVIKYRATDKFDPKIMKPIKYVPTDDIQLDGQVAESLRIGFRLGSERVLRLETVALFKHQPSESNNDNVNMLIKE